MPVFYLEHVGEKSVLREAAFLKLEIPADRQYNKKKGAKGIAIDCSSAAEAAGKRRSTAGGSTVTAQPDRGTACKESGYRGLQTPRQNPRAAGANDRNHGMKCTGM